MVIYGTWFNGCSWLYGSRYVTADKHSIIQTAEERKEIKHAALNDLEIVSCALDFVVGNWQTDLSGGSKFGYNLLFIILLSNFMAMILQHLSLKLGVVANRDLAQGNNHSSLYIKNKDDFVLHFVANSTFLSVVFLCLQLVVMLIILMLSKFSGS